MNRQLPDFESSSEVVPIELGSILVGGPVIPMIGHTWESENVADGMRGDLARQEAYSPNGT